MSDDLQIKKSDNLTMFNPAFIDDYGFTPEEFRVFSRIMRRSLGPTSQGCTESIPKMAETLRISECLVRRALNVLEDCGAITKERRDGRTPILDFQPCNLWKPASELPAIREARAGEVLAKDRLRKAAVTPAKSVTGIGNVTTTPVKSVRGVTPAKSVTGIGNVTTTPVKSVRGVVTETTDEGIPLKDIPKGIAVAPPQKSKKAVGEKTDFQKGMEILRRVTGPFQDGAAQGNALKFMLSEGLSLQQIEKGLKGQYADYQPKGLRCTYLTLQKTIFQSLQKPAEQSDDFKPRSLPFAEAIEFGFMGVPDSEWLERYVIFKEDWLVSHPTRAAEVTDYERSAAFAERAGREGRIEDESSAVYVRSRFSKAQSSMSVSQ